MSLPFVENALRLLDPETPQRTIIAVFASLIGFPFFSRREIINRRLRELQLCHWRCPRSGDGQKSIRGQLSNSGAYCAFGIAGKRGEIISIERYRTEKCPFSFRKYAEHGAASWGDWLSLRENCLTPKGGQNRH